MKSDDTPDRPLHEPLAELESQLIQAYLAGAGQDYHSLVSRDDEHARELLTEACQYASSRLSEIEARLHYLSSLHGQP